MLRARRKASGAARGRVLERVVDQVGQRLGHELARAQHRQALLDFGAELDAVLLGGIFVELGQVRGQFGGVEHRGIGRLAGGLKAGDGQDGIEGLEQAVGLGQRSFQRRHRLGLAAFGVDQGDFQLGAHAGQRRAQVVGHGVPGVADGGDG